MLKYLCVRVSVCCITAKPQLRNNNLIKFKKMFPVLLWLCNHMFFGISCQGEFREDNFNTAMQVLRDVGDTGGNTGGKWDPKGRRGGTKG